MVVEPQSRARSAARPGPRPPSARAPDHHPGRGADCTKAFLAHIRLLRDTAVSCEFSVGWTITDREHTAIALLRPTDWTPTVDIDGNPSCKDAAPHSWANPSRGSTRTSLDGSPQPNTCSSRSPRSWRASTSSPSASTRRPGWSADIHVGRVRRRCRRRGVHGEPGRPGLPTYLSSGWWSPTARARSGRLPSGADLCSQGAPVLKERRRLRGQLQWPPICPHGGKLRPASGGVQR
jgi:hypothetical protein